MPALPLRKSFLSDERYDIAQWSDVSMGISTATDRAAFLSVREKQMNTADLEDADLDFVIDINQEWQCRWWSYGLRVTPDELREAVRAVGSSANAVRDYFAMAAIPKNQPFERAAAALGASASA